MTTSKVTKVWPQSWPIPFGSIADRLFGHRLRASIDRRVRTQISERIGDVRELVTDTISRPRVQQLIALEVARQVAATTSPKDQHRVDSDFTTDVFFGSRSRYDRMLTASRYRTLATEITALTGHTNPEWPMRQAYRAVIDQESHGLGRIAGSTYNIIGKLVVPVLLQPSDAPILEIGTLFALFSPALVRQFRRVGHFPHLTVIDPLEGIQIQPELTDKASDPTGTPVTAEVARRNLEASGLTRDEFRIVRGFSTDPVCRTEVADRRYGVVIVDGDHSEGGVYQDLWWVQDLLAPGGIAVMDDFGDPRWPGVERAGRRYLADGGRLELLGTASTSAYLRMPG